MVGSRLTEVGVESTLTGTGKVCDMIRPEGMSRPEGSAMQTKPGTGMICDMIRLKGMSHPVGTAMQIKSRKAFDEPRMFDSPCGHDYEPPRNGNTGHGHDL